MIRRLLLELGATPIGKDPLVPDDMKLKLGESTSRLTALLMLTYMAAMKGESWAVHFIADRTEGKVSEAPAPDNMDQRAQLLSKISSMVYEALPPPAVPTTFTLDEGEVL